MEFKRTKIKVKPSKVKKTVSDKKSDKPIVELPKASDTKMFEMMHNPDENTFEQVTPIDDLMFKQTVQTEENLQMKSTEEITTQK